MSETEGKKRGRPAKYPGEGKRTTHTFRIREATRQKLIQAAAASGRSVSEEIEWRVERSFDQDEIMSVHLKVIEENSQLQIENLELQAEVERLKSAGPDTSDLEAIVERAVARALERVLGPKDQEPEQPQPATDLPSRERMVLELLIAGASNREIAHKLGITRDALKAEIVAIMKKIKVRDQAQAIAWARQHLKPANDFMHEAHQYQSAPKTAHKARSPAKTKA
ncbi:MAG TPA: LuxR C-terminal-related transcriptional regulator [Microvirga sp.]|nr:LuxR C-terminal-related transcriptional regulator [Microvirga sp.]